MNSILQIPGWQIFKLSGRIFAFVGIVGTIKFCYGKFNRFLLLNRNLPLPENECEELVDLYSIMLTGITCVLISKIDE